MYEVTFNCVQGIKTINFNGETTLKEMIDQYSTTLKTGTSISNLIFLTNGDLISSNSDKKLNTIFRRKTTILVLDAESGIENNNDSPMDKINANQFKEKNMVKMPRNIKRVLEDMAVFGCITKKLIDNTLSIGVNTYITIDEATQKDPNDPIYILGIFGKYLKNLGIETVIDKNYGDNKDKNNNLSNTILQFIFNGLIFKKKYYLSFNLNDETIKKLFQNRTYKENFKNTLQKAISEEYGLYENDVIITEPIRDKYYLLIVLLKDDNINLTKENLQNKFQHIPDLCNLINVKKENIIEGIILNTCMLDSYGDNKKGNWDYYTKRGGEEYLPPEGWIRYGLKVYNQYDNRNNNWLRCDNGEGEWCVAYSWLSYGKNALNFNNMYENEEDIKNIGKKVGKGIYTTQNPEFMEEITESVNIKGKEYKLGLMLRVNPEKIRCPKNKDELWVVDGNSDEIRPYGILIKSDN